MGEEKGVKKGKTLENFMSVVFWVLIMCSSETA
jgi:hypothetical protein